MQIGVFGAGAVGAYIGGRLSAAGESVTLIGRMKDEVAAHGLTLTDYSGARVVLPPEHVRYFSDGKRLADCDVVLLTVKSAATANAAVELAPHLAPSCTVISLQNGVRNVPTLRAALPAHAVLAGMVPFNVRRLPNAHFHNGTSGPLELERAPASEALATVLGRAGFHVVLHDDLGRVQWSKLVFNLNNALNALVGIPLREQLGDRRLRRLMASVVREALACLKAANIAPVRIGHLVPAWAPTVLSLPDWLFERIARRMVQVDPTARSSMWEDLERRRQTEVDFLNGEIVRLGETHGVPTPINRAIVALVKEAERAGQGSPNMAAETLERAIATGATLPT